MRSFVLVLLTFALAAPAATAQTFPTGDPVLQRIWQEGMERSRVEPLAQVLLDSIGPRLVGTPQMQAAHDWAVRTFAAWGVPARNEAYGTWRAWERGTTHADLIAPRVRSLDAMMLAWSPPTQGAVEGPVVVLPDVADEAAFAAWLPQVRGAFVAVSFPQPTCRPDGNWEEHALPATVERMKAARAAAQENWSTRVRAGAASPAALAQRLEAAGAAGLLTSNWSGGWGAERVFGAQTERIPMLSLSCEDYGLVARLAERGQGPRLRVRAESRDLGTAPAMNTIAEMRGRELPDEYVVLSAHFDSWDGASGATDNGTGTVVMMEAMRILRAVYPNPRRTILVGLWGGEEQGLNGSRAFTEDNPHVVEGLQALFNQDNGTGRIASISMQGFPDAGAFFARWFAGMPNELVGNIRLALPGMPSGGGTDHASFVCHGAPAFSLSATPFDYFTYTWHTNRDTYDKISFEDVQMNAVLTAMLAYLASEDPERLPRTRREMPVNAQTGEREAWPACRPAQRSAPGR
ncbi:MAG: M20/M25/M40 family metallo-hydrolase [Rubricoccaceae bacterium]